MGSGGEWEELVEALAQQLVQSLQRRLYKTHLDRIIKLKMRGILLSRSEGALKDSVIKLNYIFTVSDEMVSRVIFHLSEEKKMLMLDELTRKLSGLKP